MLICQDLTVHQGGKCLWQGLELSLRPGERLGISAPSGFGKTTLGRVLAGWQKATSGTLQAAARLLPGTAGSPAPGADL